MADSAIELRDNADKRRYEALVGDRLAKVDYFLNDDVIILVHTEVPEELEGQGIGSKLAKFALDDIRARGLRVVPSCPFVAGYIERHPEYRDIVRG